MILLFIGIFTNTGINTLKKEYIIAAQNKKIYGGPSLISLNKNKNFYFMIGLSGVDMNSGIRYFDVSMTYAAYNNSVNSSRKIMNKTSLGPCKMESWSSFDKSIIESVHILNPEKWLCPADSY
jgi:hypothetical protein